MTVLNGALEQTTERYITETALKWTGREGSCINIKKKISDRERKEIVVYEMQGKRESILERGFGFHCFVYSEKVSSVILTFRFGEDGKEALQFEYCLNYTGWKEINLPYERGFMRGSKRENMNRLSICMSGCGQEEIVVYIDDIRLCEPMNPLHVYSRMCDRVKELGRHTKRSTAWEFEKNGLWLNRPIFLPEKLTASAAKDFGRIEKRYLELCNEMDMPPSEKFVMPSKKNLLEFWKEYNLMEDDHGRITGKHITDTTSYIRMMKALAYEYRNGKEVELLALFRLVFVHLQDQNTVINWYNGRGAASSLLLMKPWLKEMGMLETATDYIKRAYEFGKVYDVTSKSGVAGCRFEDSDAIGMELPSLLACILLMEDSEQKMVDMRHFVNYIEEYCLGFAPGIASGCKKDGTISHHGGYIRQYQTVAVYSIARVIETLEGTQFMVGQKAQERLRNILLTEYVIYQGVYESFCLSQYFFDAKKEVSVCEFAHAARAFHDREYAAMYLRLAQTSSREMETKDYQEFQAQGILPAPLMDVHKTLTSAAAAVHRRGKFSATVRGHSQYVFPMEIWPDEFGSGSRYSAFALYRSFGFLELAEYPLRDTGVQNGIIIDKGFDYRRWSGATAVCLPYEQLRSRPLDIDDEWAEWLLSDQPFVGGLDDSRNNGIFVLQLHGHPKYGLESFRANKSYHFYEDMVLCLGSGISSECAPYNTETTIFQDYGSGAERDGKILTDNRNNGYYVWDEERLEFFEKDNFSRDMKDQECTSGHRVYALLNHGGTPKDASYRYLIRMGKGAEGIRQIGAEEKIHILRQDKYAHIVQMYKKTDYVLFRKDYELHDRYIESVTESCLITVIENEDDSVNLAVCDPDLRFYYGESEDYDLNRNRKEKAIYGRFWNYQESRPSVIWLVLNQCVQSLEDVKGRGRIVQRSETQTILEFICVDGMTQEVKIRFS